MEENCRGARTTPRWRGIAELQGDAAMERIRMLGLTSVTGEEAGRMSRSEGEINQCEESSFFYLLRAGAPPERGLNRPQPLHRVPHKLRGRL
jgi:hypothetical protein